MKIYFAAKSDRGIVRKANEDYHAGEKVGDGEYIFVVADGMGGHRAGDVASRVGTRTFVSQYKKFRKDHPVGDTVVRSLESANLAILARAQADERKRGMGTTFSAMALADMRAHIAHVGDSRIYLIREGRMVQLTTDHTLVGKMLQEGRITAEEARDHPQKNILYMSLGSRRDVEPEITDPLEVREGDIFVMCSDGLNNMVTDDIIKEYVLSYDMRESVDRLVDLANENGGTDNITLQVIQVEQHRDPAKTEPLPVVKTGIIATFFRRLMKRVMK